MSEWKEVPLGELASVKGGKRLPKGSQLVDQITTHPYIRTCDIQGGQIKENQLLFVPDEVFPKIRKYIVEKDDIIVSIVGTIGSCAIIPESLHLASLTENCAKIVEIDTNRINRHFLIYFLSSERGQQEIDKRNVGSTQPKLPLYNIKDIPIPLPPISEQRKIAEVLFCLDEKINLLYRQSKTLENIAATVFNKTFYYDAQTDWEIGTLESILEFNPKLRLNKKEVAPYLEMANVATDNSSPIDWCNREFTSGMRFQNGDTLLARITPCLENGKTCFVQFLDNGQIGWGSTEFVVMRVKGGIHPLVSYLVAKDNDFREFVISVMSGSSGRQRAQAEDLKRYEIAIPPTKFLEELNEICSVITPKLANNFRQAQTLISLRDMLLSKIMSNQIHVKCDEAA